MPAHVATTRQLGEVVSLTITWWHPSALTPAEHNARAMVMGRYYNAVMHDYRVTGHAGLENKADPIDADTLEPVRWSTYMAGREWSAYKEGRERRAAFKHGNSLSDDHMGAVVRACYYGGIDYATVL